MYEVAHCIVSCITCVPSEVHQNGTYHQLCRGAQSPSADGAWVPYVGCKEPSYRWACVRIADENRGAFQLHDPDHGRKTFAPQTD